MCVVRRGSPRRTLLASHRQDLSTGGTCLGRGRIGRTIVDDETTGGQPPDHRRKAPDHLADPTGFVERRQDKADVIAADGRLRARRHRSEPNAHRRASSS